MKIRKNLLVWFSVVGVVDVVDVWLAGFMFV